MALAFTTGMTLISAADAVTNWAAVRISGSGGAPAATLDTVTFKQGSGSISSRVSGANWDSGLFFDYYTANGNTTLNLTTAGNEVLSIWMLCTSPSAVLALQNGGAWIAVSSSADTGATVPTAYRRWYVSGADVYPGGWVLIQIDTRKTASVADVGSPNLAAVRRIGVGLKIVASPPTLRSDNLYVDAMWYGRPTYGVKGDGSTVATWGDFLTNSVTNANGLIQDLGGVYQIACGIRFGDAPQAATTTFADATGKQILFKRQTYYYGGVVDALNYADYYIVDAVGAASYKTSVTMGSVVGAGDGRRGVLGGALRNPDPANVTVTLDFRTGVANLAAAKLYGVDLVGVNGGVLLEDDAVGTLAALIGGTLVNCAELDLGATYFAELLAASFIGAATQALTVGSASELARSKFCNFINCNSAIKITTASLEYGSAGHQFSGNTYDIENSSGGAVTVTPSNLSNVSTHHETGGGSTTISNDVILTISANVTLSGAEIRIYDLNDTPAGSLGTELSGAESHDSSTYQFTGPAGNEIWVQIMKPGYEEFGQATTLPAGGGPMTVILVPERNA